MISYTFSNYNHHNKRRCMNPPTQTDQNTFQFPIKMAKFQIFDQLSD